MIGYLRLIAFFLIWLLFFIEQYDSSLIVVFLFICSFSVLLFYLIVPLQYKSLYTFIHILLLCSLLLLSGSEIILYLLLYLHIDSITHLSIKNFWTQGITLFLILLVCLQLSAMFSINRFLAIVMLLTFSFFYRRKHDYSEEKRELYAELVREYRLVKRNAYRNEKGARTEERTRIAREIHDAVGHKLTSLLMLLRIKSLSTEHDYEDVVQLAEEALHETRKAVTTLENEESEGLASVIQLIRKLESESHITVSFTTEKGVLSTSLTNEQNVCLYRMLQEALTNAMKHAHSREVAVTLRKNAIGHIEFIVSNSVREQRDFSEGFGLRNMKERIQELGGNVSPYYEGNIFILKGSFPEERSI